MIIDANILLYAVDADSSFHTPAASWLQDAINTPQRIGIPWQSIGAFLRISTHPRISRNPLSPTLAWEFVSDWLAARTVWVPPASANTALILGELIAESQVTSKLMQDAQLAALAIEYGVPVVSNDSDFARFPRCAWINPLA
jgi:toxin-antitoxin system PIN domain toxin